MAHPKTTKPHKSVDPDDAKLAAAGFDAHAPASDALAKLAEIRASVGDAAYARGLGNIADPAGAAILAGMEPSASGALRREVRRSLFKLHQRGIDAPALSVEASHAGHAPATELLTALFSPIDGEGARIIWITKPRMQGGVTRLWGLVSESEGLVGAMGARLSRKELKSERTEIEGRAGIRMVEGDPHLADFILCEAYRRMPEARRVRVGDFLALRAEIIATPVSTELVHPIYDELGADIAAEPATELLKEPELLEWRLSPDEIAPYVEELGRANESVIVLNEIQQRERINIIVERAVGEMFSGDRGIRARRRFEDLAYYILHSGRRQAAAWAAAAARQIQSGSDLKRSIFFQSMVRTQLGAIVAQEQQREEQEPRLIVTPAEAMRASDAARRRR
ncbi:MAG: hypothetical protein ACYDC3_01255 [Candidatus Binataceae bacterium]